jgi:hypothetical protein
MTREVPKRTLTRLKQYKLLETRKRDEQQVTGSNEEFSRGCDVRVCIESDVLSNIDRAIELINRTNQLNYTKNRLPEDIDEARKILSTRVDSSNHQAGLVRVADKYGDYGFVGFFETENGRKAMVPGTSDSSLLHYCFSCRTLGMYIEQWLYDYLRRPELQVVGEVLTDFSVPRVIDWVRLVPTIDDPTVQQTLVATEIVLGGGCESNSVGVYLGAYTNRISVYGNFISSGLFVHFDSAVYVLDTCNRDVELFSREAEVLGLPIELMAQDIIADRSHGCAYIFNFSKDCFPQRSYQHKVHGWKFWIDPASIGFFNFVETSDEELVKCVNDRVPLDTREHILRAARHIKENYDVLIVDEAERIRHIRELIERIPSGSKFIIAMNHDEIRDDELNIVPLTFMTRYTGMIRELADEYSYVGVASFSEAVRCHDEIHPGANHYSRPVFLRFAERVVEVLGDLSPKP